MYDDSDERHAARIESAISSLQSLERHINAGRWDRTTGPAQALDNEVRGDGHLQQPELVPGLGDEALMLRGWADSKDKGRCLAIITKMYSDLEDAKR